MLSACKTLREYAEYVERVRKYVRNMELEEAVDQAITECIQEGILSEFLKKNRAEAKSVSIYEYDMEKHMRMERAEAREEGKREGIKEGMEKGLQEGRTKLLQEMVQKKRSISRKYRTRFGTYRRGSKRVTERNSGVLIKNVQRQEKE